MGQSKKNKDTNNITDLFLLSKPWVHEGINCKNVLKNFVDKNIIFVNKTQILSYTIKYANNHVLLHSIKRGFLIKVATCYSLP
jgi:hypothetical protein